MNESYTSFAQVYDMFMDNVDYPAWSKYLIQLLKEYLAKKKDIGYNEDEVQKSQIPSGLCG